MIPTHHTKIEKRDEKSESLITSTLVNGFFSPTETLFEQRQTLTEDS